MSFRRSALTPALADCFTCRSLNERALACGPLADRTTDARRLSAVRALHTLIYVVMAAGRHRQGKRTKQSLSHFISSLASRVESSAAAYIPIFLKN
jgi:hypothetical protein